jgi:hypothetical protein
MLRRYSTYPTSAVFPFAGNSFNMVEVGFGATTTATAYLVTDLPEWAGQGAADAI